MLKELYHLLLRNANSPCVIRKLSDRLTYETYLVSLFPE